MADQTNYKVPPVVGTLTLNNGRTTAFYDQAQYDRALAQGATPVDPPPAGTTTVDGKEVSTNANVPPPADTLTTGESQSTSVNDGSKGYAIQDETGQISNIRKNEYGDLYYPAEQSNAVVAPTSSGAGAGTTGNAATSKGADDNLGQTTTPSSTTINTSTAALNSLIPTQPNQLDQYASYTYSIGWYLLSTEQFNDMAYHKPNVAGWQLLMQSGGAPAKGRSPAFPLDYYMDDLEIETLAAGGTNMPNSAMSIRFKVTEPNGITLLQSIFNAVQSVYKNAQQSQTNTTNNGAPTAKSPSNVGNPNYLEAHYCLVIEFFGYDSSGKLVAPAKGSFNTSSGYGQTAVIRKFYPFRIVEIKFAIANRAIEYAIKGQPIHQAYALTTDRGTVPWPFAMTGQTVDQLLNGPQTSAATTKNTGPGERKTTPNPGIAPGIFVDPIQATGNITQPQADTLNLLAAGQLGS